MPTPSFTTSNPLCSVLLLLLLAVSLLSTVHAFGAGSIPPSSPVKGTNWLHGDVTSVLLSIPKSTGSQTTFTEHEVRIIYFGSWLRDLSQVIDAGILKLVPEAVLRAVVGVLAYLEFGKATGEFEVTKERLGCYRHEEHIDNTKGYETEGNANLDPRLRTEIDEKEYEVDDDNGMLKLVASEGQVEFTAAGYVRKTLSEAVRLGREGRRRKDEKMVHEAYILLGAVLHVLDDFAAHSNYIELALHLLGEKEVFLYTGDKAVEVGPEGRKVAPLVTGTFGTEDLWHSLLGTVNDKAATQGIEHPQTSLIDLEDKLKDARADIGGSSSSLLDQLSLVPSGIIPQSLRDLIDTVSKSSEELKEQEDKEKKGTVEEKDKHINEEIRKLEHREEKMREGAGGSKGEDWKKLKEDVKEEQKVEKSEKMAPKAEKPEQKVQAEKSEKLLQPEKSEQKVLKDGNESDDMAFDASSTSDATETESSFPLSNLAWSATDLYDGPSWASMMSAPSEFLAHIQPILELRDSVAASLSSASLPSLDSIELPDFLPNISLPDDFDINFDFKPILQRIGKAVDSATFSFLSPYMLPVVQRLRETLTVASHEMLDREGNQFDVFRADSESLCPSHSLLSKDHFTNVLQHPAGLVATVMTQLAVRAVVEAWDEPTTDEEEYKRRFNSAEATPTGEKCVDFVLSALHHPYYVHSRHSSSNKMQASMLHVVKEWWDAQPAARQRELRHVLSKDGVERGLNHRASPEAQLRGHWMVKDDMPVLEGLHGWSTRRRRAWKKSKEEGSVIEDVWGVVDGVRKDPVGSAWTLARLVVTGKVTPAGLYRDGVDTAKGVFEEAVWGKQCKKEELKEVGAKQEDHVEL